MSELLVDNLLVESHYGLLAHGAGGHWRPLRVNLADALLGNHSQVKLLVLAEHHDPDRVFLVALVVHIRHWDGWVVKVTRCDAFARHFRLVTV